MSISAGIDWIGNLGAGAERDAASVDKLTQSLRALQSVQGSGAASFGGGAGGIGAQAKEANKAVLIQTKSAADLAKIGATSDLDRNRSIGRIVQGQAKAADSAYLLQVKGGEAATRAAEKNALIETQGAIKAAHIRDKSAADAAKINTKAAADMARDSHRASLRSAGSGGGSGKAGAAAMSLAQGGGIQGAAGELGGKAGAIAAVGAVAVAAAAKVASVAYEYSKAVVAAQSFKEDIQEAFKTVRGTNAAADKTFQVAIASADRLGIKRADSIGQFLDLATKGFDDKKITEIQGRLQDMTTIDPRASIEGLTKVIGQVQATGRVNQETLNQLSTFGLEQGDVIKQIGKALNKSDADVLKQLSTAGGLRDPRNIDFILNAIAGQTGGGKAGEKAAEKADRNLSSLLDRVESIPANLLFDVKAGPGIDSIKAILKDILGFFDSSSATGERTRKVLGDVFNAIAEGLLGRRMGDKEGITGTLSALLDVADKSVPTIKATASALGTLGRAILALTSGDTSGLDTGTKRIVGAINLITSIQGAIFDMFSGGFPSIGNFIQPILDIIGIDYDASKIASFVNGVTDLLSPRNWIKMIYAGATGGDATLGNPFLTTIQGWGAGVGDWLSSGASSLGTAMVDGLVNGIVAGAYRVVDAASSLGSGAIKAIKSVIDSNSPSRETHVLGEWFSIGMGDGIDAKADYVTRAARVTAEDALIAASMSVPQLGMGASQSSSNGAALSNARTINVVLPPGPLVQIVAGPGTNVDELIELLDAPIRRLFIQIMTQVAAEA